MFGFNKADKARLAKLEASNVKLLAAVDRLTSESSAHYAVRGKQDVQLKDQAQQIIELERVIKHLSNRPTTITRVADRTHTDAPAMEAFIRRAIPAELQS